MNRAASFNAAVAAPTVPALVALTVSDLEALYEAHQAAANAVTGVMNQPCVVQDTVVCRALSDQIDAHQALCDAIAVEMRARRPASWFERYQRALFLIGHECRCGEGLQEIAALAAELAATEH